MKRDIDRYERLPKARAEGATVANRLHVKPGLTGLQSVQDEPFLSTLRRTFGDPDERDGAVFSYSLRDKRRGTAFEVYSGSSGPSYGGHPGNGSTADVLEAAVEFERWLEE
jgi:hypothetical protein